MSKVCWLVLFGLVMMAAACTSSEQATSKPLIAKQATLTSETVLTHSPDPTRLSSPFPSVTAPTTSLPTEVPPTPTLSPALASLRIAFGYDHKLWLWQNAIPRPLTGLESHALFKISDD